MKRKSRLLAVTAALLFLAGILAACRYSETISWRLDRARSYLAGLILPVRSAPQVNDEVQDAVDMEPATATPFSPEEPSGVTPSASAGPLPSHFYLSPPQFDRQKDFQTWNNCGPATLALALRYWGWQGDQRTVAAVIKPAEEDKNVNIEELAGYARQQANLKTVVRVAGDLETLKRLISAGYPVIVETSFQLNESFWPSDDRWSSHFTLLTGFSDDRSSFTAQDVYLGPDTRIGYDKLASDWQSFNYVYLVIYPQETQEQVAGLLGTDWSEPTNLQNALALAIEATQEDPANRFAWFNLGSTFTSLGKFDQAWLAFEKARQLGLPQRMLRYQFTPFIAAYQTGHIQDLLSLTGYALQVTPTSEEALYWQGKAYQAVHQNSRAKESFMQALAYRPGYSEAIAGLNSLN